MRLSQLWIQLSIIITLYQFTRVLATETVDSSEDDEEEEMFEVKNVPVSQKAGEELYQYWTDQAFSALMAAVAEEKLKDLSKKDKKSHHLCVKTSRSVETHARCVSQLLNWHEEKLERNSEEKKERRNTTNDEKKEKNERNETTIQRSENKTTVPTNNQSKVISEILYPIVPKERTVLPKTTPKIETQKRTKTSYFYPLQKALSSSKFEEETKKRKKFGPLWKILNGNERVLVMKREKEKNGMRNTVVMRTKRDVKSKSSYTLADSTLNRGDSLGKILEKVTNVIRVVKNKSEKPMSWQDLISEIRDAGERLKRKKAIREEYSDRIKDIQDMASALQLDISQPLEIVGALDKLDGLVQSADSEKRLNDDAGMLRRRIDDGESREKEREPTAKELAARAPIHFIREGVKLGMMLGGKDTKGFEKKNIKIFSPKFLEMAPDRTEDSVHLLSPKFFTLHNETKDPIERALSIQNLLESTHHDGHQQMMNFIMEASGVTDVLQKIAKMEKIEDFSQMAQLDPRMFGDPELMEKVKKGLEIPHPAPEEDNLEGIEKRNIGEMLEKLSNGVNTTQEYKIQMIDFQERGRTILTRRQRMLLYGKGSPFESEDTLKENEDTDRKIMDKHLESTIRDLSVEGRRLILKNKKLEMKTNITKSIINEDSTGAFSVCAELKSDGTCLREEKLNSNVDNSPVIPYNKTKEFGKKYLALNRRHVMHKRVKRWGVYGTPIAFTPIIRMPVLASQPFILSPIIFSPLILSPCVFGILVLSPWIFTPIIVSPRVLAPIILSPELMDPLILSPLVLDPIIVSPGCGVPLILTPFVMSPFIVSPQVMTPLILTPLLLSPIILTPHVLTPLILSPLLLSPIILSPSYVGALVLSPTALSPAYLSKGEVFTAVMSPSILS